MAMHHYFREGTDSTGSFLQKYRCPP